MHTSKVLRSTDFHYRALDHGHDGTANFHTFCPHYHAFDRIGVVAPYLTTAFYDVLRARTATFFDYPHHFALLDVNGAGVRTRVGRLPLSQAAMGSPWGALDVWPESNWIPATGTVTGMLYAVFERQITRLFWPQDFMPTAPVDVPLAPHVQALLTARLHTVYYYNTAHPNLALYVTDTVEEIVQRSRGRLPHEVTAELAPEMPRTETPAAPAAFPYGACYRQVSGQAFLATMASCFATPATH
jgi:hypothetical protein